MNKSKGFLSILIPSATVFISSACIMILELVASRLIARHLGSSLYTWTAVIGIVLAGITIGNYLGGRIADKFKARKALSTIFILSSAACVAVVILNNLVGEWLWLWKLSWPVRVFSHVALVFLGPSLLLGTISPVVAKMALDRGLSTGRTVGDIYAWGAAGSIFGTFAAGFYLIPAMGTIAIIWSVGAALLVMGILYWVRLWPAYLWLTVFLCALVMGMAPAESMQKVGTLIGLREKLDPQILYQDETAYCYIAVKQITKIPDKRLFMQDKLMHSEILMDQKNDLLYFHTVVFAALTHGLSDKGESLSVLHIGGGGYVFPQYIEAHWPGSRNDVAEIDPGVTKAAMAAFGLSENTSINTIQMDARNYIDELLRKKQTTKYDFIYEDAFSDYSVPYQLVTKEFNDKIADILADDGVYMINSIDIYNSARFLGAYVCTLEQTFPYVYVIAEDGPHSNRKIFVLIASKKELEPDKLIKRYTPGQRFWYLNNAEMASIRQKSRQIILTDNYVPVENLLAPVVHQSAKDLLVGKKQEQVNALKQMGKLDEAIAKYEEIIELEPSMSTIACYEIAMIKAAQGNYEEAVQNFRKAIKYNEQESEFKENTANLHYSLGTALKMLGKSQESSQEFLKAIEEYREEIKKNPNSIKIHVLLGDSLAELGEFAKAAMHFRKAVELNPEIIENQFNLIRALEFQGQFDEAIKASQEAVQLFTQTGDKNAANQFQQYIEHLEFEKSKNQRQ